MMQFCKLFRLIRACPLVLTCTLSMTNALQAQPIDPPIEPPLPDPRLHAIPVCYDFACKNRSLVSLSLPEWKQIAAWFDPPAKTPQQELQKIKQAVGWMEVLIGRHTPTHRDLAASLPPIDNYRDLFPGQMDCIDEATNTTTYMQLFQQHGLMRHFRVVETAYRKAIIDQHWAAQIQEKTSGKLYVVDSWFHPNGYLPVIQAREKWGNPRMVRASNSRPPSKTKTHHR